MELRTAVLLTDTTGPNRRIQCSYWYEPDLLGQLAKLGAGLCFVVHDPFFPRT